MAAHPAAGRTKTQIEYFERVAIGQHPGPSKRTIDALLKAGLIEQTGTQILGRDVLGTIGVPVYEVPLHHHIAWCQWCSENVADDED